MCVQDKTVEISVRLSPKQLDHVAPVLEEIIHEIVEERQKGTILNGGKYITAHPQHSLESPVISVCISDSAVTAELTMCVSLPAAK